MQPLSSFLVSLNTSGFLHTAFVIPLFLVLGDFFSGVASSLKNGTFDFSRFADVMGKDSDLLKYAIGALTLFLANSLHFLSPELNVLFATGGVGTISLVIANSIIKNLIELLPAKDQPIAQNIVASVEQEVQSVLSSGTVTPPPLPLPVVDTQQATTSVPAVVSAPVPPAPLAAQAIDNPFAPTLQSAVMQGQQFKMPSGI